MTGEDLQKTEPSAPSVPAEAEAQAAAPQGGEEGGSAGRKRGGDMKKRLLTGIVYVLVLTAFFLMKIFVWMPYTAAGGEQGYLRIGNLCFDVLIGIFAGIGTWEMLRAFSSHLHKSQKCIVMFFALLVLIAYSLSDFYFADILAIRLPGPIAGEGGSAGAVGRNYSLHITFVVFIAGIAMLFALLVFKHEKVSLESTGYALLSYLYPSFFLLVLAVCNHLEKYSEMALLLVLVVCPFADSLALVFGKLFGKKLPAKMAPHVSPQKTVVGGFGGLFGGAVAAVVIYFVCYALTLLDRSGLIVPMHWSLSLNALDIFFYIALGVLTAAFSQFGDLVESAVKRKLGIKDMGKLLPGHGGILDRIDSTLYASLIVCFVIVVRIMIVG